MGGTLAAFVFALIMVVLILELVRRKVFREKYAALWLIVGIGSLFLAGWPGLLETTSRLLGVQVASNFLFALSILLLMGVCLHLSWELSRSEDRSRVLAEEIALLRHRVGQIEEQRGAPPPRSGDEDGPDREG